MNAPIYTPFFIHPTQKKRIARKRNVVMQHEPYGPVLDNRSRRPTLANGNGEWPMQVQPQESSAIALHTRSKRARNVVESNNESTTKIDIEEGLHDVAAEVEVNVEDDSGDPNSSNSLPPKPIYSSEGSNSGNGSATASGNIQMTGGSGSEVRQFDPDSCNDVVELRNRLFAAYDRVDHLSRVNVSHNRIKQENFFLKNEVNKRDSRIGQLESIVLERNLRLKQLLSENVLMSARIKRIQSEFGVDAVKEIFNRDKV